LAVGTYSVRHRRAPQDGHSLPSPTVCQPTWTGSASVAAVAAGLSHNASLAHVDVGTPRLEAVASRGGQPCAAKPVTPPMCAARYIAARRGAPPTATRCRGGERRTLRRQRHREGTAHERPYSGPRAATGSANAALLRRGHGTPRGSRRSGPRDPPAHHLVHSGGGYSPHDAMAQPTPPATLSDGGALATRYSRYS
jgi:hypothetical protein